MSDDDSTRIHLPVVDSYRPPGAPLTAEHTPTAEATDAERTTSCIMCDGLYVKANGELPCWCDVGEDLILDEIDAAKLLDPGYDLINHPRLLEIRSAFHVEGRYPFPELCGRCAMIEPSAPRMNSLRCTKIGTLHVESSWLCNLDCPLCIPKAERKNIKTPPYHLEADTWVALIANLQRHGVEHVEVLHFEGRGDPLMHPHLAHLCKVFTAAYPNTTIQATTNGNFVFDPALFQHGLRHLRISADGAKNASYKQYRRGGSFDRVYAFMRDAAEARRRLQLEHVLIEWKYILFEWNDSDEEMLDAYRIADELGITLTFCLTPWGGKSLRFDQKSLDVKLEELMPRARNAPTRHIELGLSIG